MGAAGKLFLAAAALAAAVVLFLVLRPDSDEPSSGQPTEPTSTGLASGMTATGEAETGGATSTEVEEPDVQIVRLNVRAGEAHIERVDVPLDKRVVLLVRADVADEVHVHGYDLMAAVALGQPARIAFRATIPGQFEVELEDAQRQIAQLTVEP